MSDDQVEILTATEMRQVWRAAAWSMLGRGKLRYAWEAYRNSHNRTPPMKWSTGADIIDKVYPKEQA